MNDIASHLTSLGFVQSTPGVWTGTVPDGCPVDVTIRLHPVRGIDIECSRRHPRALKHVKFRSPCKTLDEVKMALTLAQCRWLDESPTSADLHRTHVRLLVDHI